MTRRPKNAFERQWGLVLQERVMKRLRKLYLRRAKSNLFTALQGCLAGSIQSMSYTEISTSLGMTEGAVLVLVHRMREEFGSLLRDEIAGAVTTLVKWMSEIRHLIYV